VNISGRNRSVAGRDRDLVQIRHDISRGIKPGNAGALMGAIAA
jgi:hypothetical protein